MPAPCRGCPCSCNDCVFSPTPVSLAAGAKTVVSKDEYGCVRPDGGPLVVHNELLGMMRGEFFHPVTARGAEFLHRSDNALATYC